MVEKLLKFGLLAALVCGISLSVSSCKDDDNNVSEEEKAQEQEEKTSKFWEVVGQLVSDTHTPDYQDKTFEPTIGYAESEGSLTRIVDTNDMATAARRFSDLVDVNIDEDTQSYTYNDPDVGTLTYTRGGNAEEWASVDVNIKQVPKLRKIIYRVAGEGSNASFNGKAYYRFGDVVSRTVDNQTEYWICVRPAFSIEKKGDSHWVCLNTLPTKNVEHVNKGNKDYYVPTGIDKDKEDMQNLAEMLYAICYPKEWYETAEANHTDTWISYKGVPIFADFKQANLKYHNRYFWGRVQKAWTDKKIADEAMNCSMEDLFNCVKKEGGTGINLLYNGYSWWYSTSWNCKLWQASYTHGTKKEELNMHHAEYTEPKHSMEGIEFDCFEMGKKTENYEKFFNNDGKLRWVIRHATGKELNGGSQPDPTSPLQGGCEDVYRYYTYYKDEYKKTGGQTPTGPEITEIKGALSAAKVGAIVGLNGKFYENKLACEEDETTPIALVVHVSTDGKRVEKGKPWTGLALALEDVKEEEKDDFVWLDEDNTLACGDLCSTVGVFTLPTDLCSGILDGWAMTQKLANHTCFASHRHICAEKAWSTENRPANFSEWFLPSIGQWILAMKSMGCDYSYNNNYWNISADDISKLWTDAGVPDSKINFSDNNYASTTQDNEANQVIFVGDDNFNSHEKDYKFQVRRMIAFGDGGNKDPEAIPQPIQPKVGAVLSKGGYCYANFSDLEKLEGENSLLGMVVYYSPNKHVEDGEDYNGLAVTMKDVIVDNKELVAWCGDNTKLTAACGTPVNGVADYTLLHNGLSISLKFTQSVDGHSHPGIKKACNFASLNNLYSETFVPSASQWILAKEGLGYTWSNGSFNTAGKWPWAAAGLAQYAMADVANAEYWTVTEQKDGENYKVLAVKPTGTKFVLCDKTEQHRIRPFIAFGHWGGQD